MPDNNFLKVPTEMLSLIVSKVRPKDIHSLASVDKFFANFFKQAFFKHFEASFKQKDRETFDKQTKFLFKWIATNPNKLVEYCKNTQTIPNWIRMLSEGLEYKDADWMSQFSRLFFINALLNGPVIIGPNNSSITNFLSADKVNDTTGLYDTYLFYIAKLYPEKAYNAIKNTKLSETDPEIDPEIRRIGRLASLYEAFPPLTQKDILEYILSVLPASLGVNYLRYATNSTATAKNLVAIMKIAFQLEPSDRSRIKTIIQNAYDTNSSSANRYDANYLEIVLKILSMEDIANLNTFIQSYNFYIYYFDSRYLPLGEWLLEQVPSDDFSRVIELAQPSVYCLGYITWVRKQFDRRMDVSLIDKSLYNLFVKLIENPLNEFELIKNIIENVSAKCLCDFDKLIDQKQLEGGLESLMEIKEILCNEHGSFYRESNFPSYLPVEIVNRVLFWRYLLGQPVHEEWVKKILVEYPTDFKNNKDDNNDTYTDVLAVAPYTTLLTPLQKTNCIDILLTLIVYIRTNKLHMLSGSVCNENVVERAYIALLKLAPEMSAEQSVEFGNKVLEDLSFNNEHTLEIANILFENRKLIDEKLANRLIHCDAFNVNNMRLLVVMRAENYTCTELNVTAKGPK